MHEIVLGPQAAKREPIAAARLLDQGRHTQGAKDAVAGLAHVIFDRQHKAGGQLTQRRTGAGKGGAVGEEAALGQQVIKGVGRGRGVAAVLIFRLGDMIGDAVEHAGRRFEKRAVIVAAQIALLQHLDAVLTQVDGSITYIVRTGQVDALALDVFYHRMHRLCNGGGILWYCGGSQGIDYCFGHTLSPIQHDKYGYLPLKHRPSWAVFGGCDEKEHQTTPRQQRRNSDVVEECSLRSRKRSRPVR